MENGETWVKLNGNWGNNNSLGFDELKMVFLQYTRFKFT